MNYVHYVAGLLISDSGLEVALIEKRRPLWQQGYLNGIGGHIEPKETAAEAMVREFYEETGANVTTWKPFCTLLGSTWDVEWFKAFGSCELNTMTDERVSWVSINDILTDQVKTIPNIKWLILMALDINNVTATVHDPT